MVKIIKLINKDFIARFMDCIDIVSHKKSGSLMNAQYVLIRLKTYQVSSREDGTCILPDWYRWLINGEYRWKSLYLRLRRVVNYKKDCFSEGEIQFGFLESQELKWLYEFYVVFLLSLKINLLYIVIWSVSILFKDLCKMFQEASTVRNLLNGWNKIILTSFCDSIVKFDQFTI